MKTGTRGEHHVKMEAESRVVQLEAKDAKDGWLAPEARREARTDSPSQLSGGAYPADTWLWDF